MDSLYINQILKFDFTLNNKNSKLKLDSEENDSYKSKLNLHELLRNEEILSKYLYEYKEMPTKKLINKVVIERFEIDILKVIRDDYTIEDNLKEKFILFEYNDGIITRGNAFDITEIVKGMI